MFLDPYLYVRLKPPDLSPNKQKNCCNWAKITVSYLSIHLKPPICQQLNFVDIWGLYYVNTIVIFEQDYTLVLR